MVRDAETTVSRSFGLRAYGYLDLGFFGPLVVGPMYSDGWNLAQKE